MLKDFVPIPMLPIFVKLGPVAITSFGLMLALGFVISTFFSYRVIKESINVEIEDWFDVLFVTAVAALAGARLFYIIIHFDMFGFDLLRWLLIREKPGLTFIGAVIGASLAFVFFHKAANIAWQKIIDQLTGSLIAIIFFGQIGSLLDGFSYGGPTSLPWGIAILGQASRKHPLPAYYLLALLFFSFFLGKLIRFAKMHQWPPGSVFLLFISFYSALSLIINLAKEEPNFYLGVNIDLIFPLTLFLLTAAILIWRLRNLKKDFLWVIALLKTKLQNRITP